MSMREIFYNLGKHDASILREEAVNLSGTEIIRREMSIPYFDSSKDYSEWPIGAPVIDEEQTWVLLQPHNASYYQGKPSALRSLWGLCHTKDADKAKAWVDPYGTSGMYMKDECYQDANGKIWRCLEDNVAYSAEVLPSVWVEEA